MATSYTFISAFSKEDCVYQALWKVRLRWGWVSTAESVRTITAFQELPVWSGNRPLSGLLL